MLFKGYKIFIKFDENIDYSNLNFLGNNSFKTIDFLSKKMGNNTFLEKAKSFLNDNNKAISQASTILNQLKEYYLFPISPGELKFKNNGSWEKIETVTGILKLKNNNNLQGFSFSSIIPEQAYNFTNHHLLDPFTTFILFKALEMSDKPVRVIVIGGLGKNTLTSLLNPVDLNFLATINKFDAEFDSIGSLNFEIEFEEFPDLDKIVEISDPIEKLFYKVE